MARWFGMDETFVNRLRIQQVVFAFADASASSEAVLGDMDQRVVGDAAVGKAYGRLDIVAGPACWTAVSGGEYVCQNVDVAITGLAGAIEARTECRSL